MDGIKVDLKSMEALMKAINKSNNAIKESRKSVNKAIEATLWEDKTRKRFDEGQDSLDRTLKKYLEASEQSLKELKTRFMYLNKYLES